MKGREGVTNGDLEGKGNGIVEDAEHLDEMD